MNNKKLILTYVLITVSIISIAQAGGDYTISKSSIDAGGGISDGGSYILAGTIAQTDASTELNGGDFSLTGGFWAGGTINDIIFVNDFE